MTRPTKEEVDEVIKNFESCHSLEFLENARGYRICKSYISLFDEVQAKDREIARLKERLKQLGDGDIAWMDLPEHILITMGEVEKGPES